MPLSFFTVFGSCAVSAFDIAENSIWDIGFTNIILYIVSCILYLVYFVQFFVDNMFLKTTQRIDNIYNYILYIICRLLCQRQHPQSFHKTPK